MSYRIFVENGDVTDFPCDVLALKYAQGFHGADREVGSLLGLVADDETLLRPNEYLVVPSNTSLAARKVLFIGVPPLHQFDYEQIRGFAAHILRILASELPDTTNIGMTMHGVGYGLDEREAFLAQVAGFLDPANERVAPPELQRVTIIERNPDRAARLQTILDEELPTTRRSLEVRQVPSASTLSAGKESKNKPHVFVAMPFSKDMTDVYRFGIQGPVNAAGLLCERVDMATFTGDILARIKARIETASLVIADLTGGNPNVYLEVGYAWGKDRETLLLLKETGEELKFDVRGHRTIVYDSISDLEKKLLADLQALAL